MRIVTQYDGEDLGAGEGLLVALGHLLDPIPAGDGIEVAGESASLSEDLRAWARRAGHRIISVNRNGPRTTAVIERGPVHRSLADPPEWGVRMQRRNGQLEMRDWLVGRNGFIQDAISEAAALAPRGASVEHGAQVIAFPLSRRDDVWAESVVELYEQATANQWRAASDVPWSSLRPLDEPLESAVCQIMTFLAENEYAALYVPARFIGKIHPHFTEVALFLATVMADEARHIEVFTKRALANGGGLGIASAGTQLSLASLFEPDDFTTASFLLSVLGEGTFLDLLAFLEQYAPDPATRELTRRARLDESRHVHFGIAHVRHAAGSDQTVSRRLAAAVGARAEFLKSISGIGALVEEALVIYSGGGMAPSQLRAGSLRVGELYESMHANRVKRLAAVGFATAEADELSQQHTPNFM